MPTDSTTADLDSVDLTDLDLFAEGPPHKLFARMREEAPVHWNRSADGVNFWSLTRGEDIEAVSKDPQTFSSAQGGVFIRGDALAPLEESRNFVIFKDPPEHTVYREIVAKAFLPRTLGYIDGAIRESVAHTLDRVVERGECDLARDIADHIPLRVIARLFGDPDEDLSQLSTWSADTERGIAESTDTTDIFKRMAAHFVALVDSQLVHGVDSLAKSVSEAEVDGRRLTEEEIAFYFGMLLYGGHGPTRNAISVGMLTLMENPDQFELLRKEPSRLRCTQSGIAPPAVEEVLRWSSPVNYFARTATKNTTIHGVDIKAGDHVVMWYASASRDPAVFPRADTFDIRRPRSNVAHYAFGGGGPHFCQGAILARKMVSVALQEIIKRLPNIERSGNASWGPSTFINSLTSLPVKFTASA
jgi:cytochrome P450